VRYVVARRLEKARRAARFIGAGATALGLAARELTDAQVVLLTASDAALAPLARHLAVLRRDWSGKVVLHTCGALPSAVLRPLERRGAAIGSMHPFQTIPDPRTGVRNLPGCYWGIEGDARARRVATRLVRALGGIPFRVVGSRKALYHAAAFLTCPTIVTLMDRSARLLRLAGVPGRIARPMLGRFVRETVGNFERLGPRRALTGPAVRGDWQTIAHHRRALQRFAPDFVPVYQELVRAMMRLARRRQLPHSERAR
jgi:predicted short-subunit dehydrogenase-like oxidoreductase (DUF2520 family)